MKFKKGVNKWDLERLHPTTREVLGWLEDRFIEIGEEMTVTCIFRKKRHENDLHADEEGYRRAVDVRSKDLDQVDVNWIKRRSFATWLYDPLRPEMKCVYYHRADPTPEDPKPAYHFHIQTHPRTIKKPTGAI